MGASSVRTSITEVQISTNNTIYHKNFYTAEGGLNMAPEWTRNNHVEADYTDVDWMGTFQKSDFDWTLPNGKEFFKNHDFYAEVTHLTEMDAGAEKVLLYGDEDGDYLNEINFTVGVPLIKVQSFATHVRGGEGAVEATFIYEPIFMMPDAALRVNSNVNGNGVSGSIIGEHQSGSSCGDVADIMFDLSGGTIEYGGDLGDTARIEPSTGMYPMSLLRPILIKRATQTVEASMNIDESSIVTSADNMGVIYITGDSKTTNLTGYGILFVDGNMELAGNLNWNGIILVSGDITFSGGGTKTIYGAVVANGEAIAVNGSVDIQYDCDLLTGLHDDFSHYKMTSWRQI
jgi:hypothetical protein